MMSPEEKRELLKIARDAIAAAVRSEFPSEAGWRMRGRGVARGSKDLPADDKGYRGHLAEPRGAFVTIRIRHELRGCIGYIESTDCLGDVVADVAVKAALEDPRFPPLSPEELDQVTIEISILSPLHAIRDIEEIEVGVHGLLMEQGHRRGLLLPQVAGEYGWDRQEFLENTARKAGLPAEAWRDPSTTIYAFTAEIIHEEEFATEDPGS